MPTARTGRDMPGRARRSSSVRTCGLRERAMDRARHDGGGGRRGSSLRIPADCIENEDPVGVTRRVAARRSEGAPDRRERGAGDQAFSPVDGSIHAARTRSPERVPRFIVKVWVRIPRKVGIDSTASWAAIPRLGQSGRRVHGVSPDRSGQAVSSRPRASACSRRKEAGGGRYGRAGPEWHLPGSGRRWPRASARPGAGW